MRALFLVSVLLVSLVLGGCVGSEDVGRFWDDLEVQPRFTESVLLNVTEPFAFQGAIDPANPPQDPNAFGDRYETTFNVPNGTRAMQVLFVVNFTELPPPPDPLPRPPFAGDIRVFARPPGNGSEYNVTMEAGGSGGFDVRRPAEGPWVVGFRARGQGEVSFLVEAVVPVARAPANATLAE